LAIPRDIPDGGGDAAAADRELARRALGGDEEAFADLVNRHAPGVTRIAGRFFRRREVVEEIVQDVFVKAFTSLDSYRGDVPLAHWLSRITVNACYDQLRRKKARPEVSVSEIAEDAPGFLAQLRAPEGSDAAAFWEREEARLTAERLLAMLAPPERLVLTLMVLEDLPVAEVSRLTGWSQSNVKIRAFRARHKLRKLLP